MLSGTLPIKYCDCNCANKIYVFVFDSHIYVYYNDINLLISF